MEVCNAIQIVVMPLCPADLQIKIPLVYEIDGKINNKRILPK